MFFRFLLSQSQTWSTGSSHLQRVNMCHKPRYGIAAGWDEDFLADGQGFVPAEPQQRQNQPKTNEHVCQWVTRVYGLVWVRCVLFPCFCGVLITYFAKASFVPGASGVMLFSVFSGLPGLTRQARCSDPL